MPQWLWILLAGALAFWGIAILVDDQPPLQVSVRMPERLVQRSEAIVDERDRVVEDLRASVMQLQEEAQAINASQRAVETMAYVTAAATVVLAILMILGYRLLIRRALETTTPWQASGEEIKAEREREPLSSR